MQSKAWIHTFTGLKFYLLNPRPEMIRIEDIAHALSMLCRWTGHTKYHYSVAQHAYYCSLIVRPELALAALLHDSSEAYLNDINRPLKHFTDVGPAYLKVEEKVERVIFKKFGLQFPISPEIKQADNRMLFTEKAELINGEEWCYKWEHDGSLADIKIEQWTPRRAEKMFLRRFAELTK
jgi:5'-deoxynucleotidase YfbR-like HD superfamily hydrolase